MKKVLLLALCSLLVLSAMTGCSTTGPKENGSTATPSTTVSQASTPTDSPASTAPATTEAAITNIIWQFPTPGNNGTGFQDMEDAFNAMLEKDIGVHVKFELVPLMDSQKKAQLMVSAGEQLDISLTAFTSLGPLVDSSLIMPLNDLVDKYGQDIKSECGAFLYTCSYAGKLYGVPPMYKVATAYGYWGQTALFHKYNITIDDKKAYTLDELEAIFKTIKEGEGESFYCEIPWNTTPEPNNYGWLEYDKVAGAIGNGVLMLNKGFDTKTIVDLFETSEYKTYAEMKYRWAQAGYIAPDAAITKEAVDTLFKSKKYLGMFYWDDPAASTLSTKDMPLTCIHLVAPYVVGGGGNTLNWNIPVTTISAEKAMKALNYIYAKPEAAWLMQFGIEGKSYKVLQKSDVGILIEYTDPDTSKLPYYNPYGIWGNRLKWPIVSPQPIDSNKIMMDWDQACPKSRYSPSIGYTFVQTSVATEIAAVAAAVTQYTPSINCGALDPAKALPEFVNALKAAGVEKVIAENQKQYDAWLAGKN